MDGEAHELGVLFPVPRSAWEWWDEKDRDEFVADHVLAAAERRGVVLEDTYMGYEVSHEAVIDGLRLIPEDEFGNPLPEMVVIRSRVWVIPNEASLKELEEAASGRS
ncbi:hypothetical protein SEA_PHILLIS_38 [Mycobacterium phage Phillis]|nr:hypothetical protein SEA_PHILLIS_38 [Mycobacterium phage Phillis]